jgi:serine/threonine-protein kinase RsbW
MIMPTYEFTYPSTPASEGKMFDEVTTILQANGMPEDLQNGFMLAVSEAFTNALVHGNKRNPHKAIKLALNINEGLLTADITDEGQGGLAKIKRRQSPTLLSESGRGVDLMRHYASAVRFTETEGGGLKVSLRFDQMKENKIERYT